MSSIEQPDPKETNADPNATTVQGAATLEKTRLEIGRLRSELDPILEKYRLEIEKLSKDLSIGRITEIFLDKWIPTIIASILLFTAVPLANDKFWRSQKSIDVGISALNRMRETYSRLALSTTQFMQTAERMDILKCKDDPVFDPRDNVRQLECAQLRKDRYAVEPQIVGLLSDAELYFTEEVGKKVAKIKSLYNQLDRHSPDRAFVASFGRVRQELLSIMKSEIRAKEAILLS